MAVCAAPAAAQTFANPSPRPSADESQETVVKKKYSRGIPGRPSASAARATAVEWQPVVGMDAQLFPSFVISTATLRLPQEEDAEEDPRQLGEEFGFIGAVFDGVPANAAIKVEVRPNTIMEASVFEGRAEAGAGEYSVYPKIAFRYDALLDWRQPMPLNITMEAFVDGRSLGVQNTTVTVRSVNDCPFAVVAEDDSDEEDLDMSWMFAAYVNENHPVVNTLTREAIQSGIVDGFTGYQDEKPAQVLRQVYAIWHVLQERGIKYSDISTASAESPVVLSQHVRFFDESLDDRQANCVDGTGLFAAVLRKIGLEPYLVLVPGHMFLAFDLDAEGETTVGLETTMMGLADANGGRSEYIPAELASRFRTAPSFRSFSAAIDEGTSALEKDAEEFEGDNPEYQIISLSEARQLGILPLAYRKIGR